MTGVQTCALPISRTAKCDKLVKREPVPFVELHPADAAEIGVADGDPVQISSRRGTVRLSARLRDGACRGTVFVSNEAQVANDFIAAALVRRMVDTVDNRYVSKIKWAYAF